MFQAPMMEDPRGYYDHNHHRPGSGYGEILAPVYEYNNNGAQYPQTQPSSAPPYVPQYGYGGAQQSYGASQSPPPPQFSPYDAPMYYPPPPQPMSYPQPQPQPMFDTLLPNIPPEPAGQSQPIPRRGLLNTSTSGTSGHQHSEHGHSSSSSPTCEFCGTRKSKAHSSHSMVKSNCLSIWQHIKSCPVCSGHVRKDNRFLWGIIILLVLIILVLWFRLRSRTSRGASSSGLLNANGGKRRQPYIEAGKLSRLFQD